MEVFFYIRKLSSIFKKNVRIRKFYYVIIKRIIGLYKIVYMLILKIVKEGYGVLIIIF